MDPFEELLQRLMGGQLAGSASPRAAAAAPAMAVPVDPSGAPGGTTAPAAAVPFSLGGTPRASPAAAAAPTMPQPSFSDRLIQLGRAGGLNLPDTHAQNLTYQALIKKNVEPEIARAAVTNPAVLQQVLAAVFQPRFMKMGPGDAIADPQTRQILLQNAPKPEKQVVEIFDEATGQPRKMLWDKTTGEMAPVGGVRTERKAREFSVSDLGKLRAEGSTFATVRRLGETFRDAYSMPGGIVAGDVRNWIGRTLPEGATTPVAREAAQWWQDYKRNSELLERHELFGAALTGTEQAQWRQADINPNMEPGAIRRNLETRKTILEGGLRRYANALIQAGYDPAPIAAAFGLDLKGLGVTTERQRGATSIGDKTEPGGSNADEGWRVINGVRVREKR